MICDVLWKNSPELKDRVPERTPGSELGADFHKVDSPKANRILDIP